LVTADDVDLVLDLRQVSTSLGPVSKSVPGLELLGEDLRVSVFEM